MMQLPIQTSLFMRRLKYLLIYPWVKCRLIHISYQRLHDAEHEIMSKIRNIGVIAHIDAGKTTTTERMLYYSGYSRHLGDVDRGDTVMDYMEQERDRGITITSAAITFNWEGHKINLIDTPGHVDFTVEVERSLRVLDGAVAILDASAGVEAQTLTVWRQADHYHIPRLVFLNKMDKSGASLDHCLSSLTKKLHVKPLVLNLPVGTGKEFVGVQDLVHMNFLEWNNNSKDGHVFNKISIDLKKSDKSTEKFLAARTDLIGQLADVDEHIADLVLCDTKIEDFTAKDIISAIRSATIKQKLVPVFCGSSLKNKGVQPLLDAITLYLPSPLDISYGFVKYYGNHLCALAFKVRHDKQRGPLAFVRIYSGMLKSGAHVYNINRSTNEKSSRLLQVYADELRDVTVAVAGNIVAIAGLKETFTGDTLTSSNKIAQEAARAYIHETGESKMAVTDSDMKIKEKQHTGSEEAEVWDSVTSDMVPILAGLSVPDPVFFCSVEASSITMQNNLDLALEQLVKEDPSLKVEVNLETGQTILSGMGELHLDIIKSRLEKEYRLDVELGPLQIAYKETVVSDAVVTENVDRELGGNRQIVHIKLSVHPNIDERDFKHVVLKRSTDHPLVIKTKILKAIESGIKSGLSHGSLLNFPVIHTSVHLHEFTTRYHTTLPMITGCAAVAVQKALKEAKTVLLEPMMAMEINTDDEKLDVVLADLSRRRSYILDVSSRYDAKTVSVLTPLQELMGFSTDLRTITSGTATCTIELSHYEKMTDTEVQKVTDRITGFQTSY